jgi:hypothetical protein
MSDGMKVTDPNLTNEEQAYQQNEERVYGTDLHPRHESWARISSRGTLIGFFVFLVLAGLFLLWVGAGH